MMIALLYVVLTQAQPVGPVPCAYNHEAMMALDARTFDQDKDRGWRTVAAKQGCEAAGADLIEAYRSAHRTAMTAGNVHLSYWHEGQLRAAAGQTDRAISLLMAGVDPQGINDFPDYALGTVAFLNRDKPALEAARARLAALPLPEDWAEMSKAYEVVGITPVWPPNLDILDALVACWDQPYRKAYGSCDATVDATAQTAITAP